MFKELFQSNKIRKSFFANQTERKIPVFLCVAICVFVFLSFQFVFSEVPELISVQGRLTDASGVNKPDGLYTLNFAIFNSATGGSIRWGTEAHTNVIVKNGIFQLFLGEGVTGIKNIFSENNLWLEITVIKDGVPEVLIPRQRLVSVGYAFKAEIADDVKDGSITNSKINSELKTGTSIGYGLIPRGCIVMWSGTIANIPTGWHLCDGTNGTPNLMDRFIVGAGMVYTPNTSGGSSTIAAHTHTATGSTSTDGLHFHTANAIMAGSHKHILPFSHAGTGFSWTGDDWGNDGTEHGAGFIFGNAGNMGGRDYSSPPVNSNNGTPAADHTHIITVAGSGGHSHTVSLTNSSGGGSSIIPPYYALCYIMKL